MNARRSFGWALLLAVMTVALPVGTEAGPFKKTPQKLDARIQKYTAFLEAIQAEPTTRIPPEILSRARGVIIMREIKVGLGIGAEAGGGVALVRDGKTGKWSPPAFVASAEGSYGFQIGGQKSDTVMLLMDDLGMQLLREGGVEFGVNLRATAGPVSGGGEINVNSISEPVLLYGQTGGLYAGAAFEGGGIVPQKKANAIYYGKTMEQVLFEGRGKLTRSGQELIEKLDAYSKTGGRRAAPGASVAPLRATPLAGEGENALPEPAAPENAFGFQGER